MDEASRPSAEAPSLPSQSLPIPQPWRPLTFSLRSKAAGNPVVKQLVYEAPYCIPPFLADRQWRNPYEYLDYLNRVMGTHYTPESVPGLLPILENCISREYDFGMTYGLLREWWMQPESFPSLLSTFDSLSRADAEARRIAVHNDIVVDPILPPRRVWDLYSNRVLPIWAIEPDPDVKANSFQRTMSLFAVSHAWMSPDVCQDVETPINQRCWPVPIPGDCSLDDVRVELLNMGAEYAWLDVLCLRQKDGQPLEEAKRPLEWKLDVPTIGSVYLKCANVVVYFNGLGRPFEENDLSSSLHWCNRAWTLQEWCFASSMLMGGVTSTSPKFSFNGGPRTAYAHGPPDSYPQHLLSRLRAADSTRDYIFHAAADMGKRSAKSELDKIGGLAYNFSAPYENPTYIVGATAEDMWTRHVLHMKRRALGELFFLFPSAGDSSFAWSPSWRQLLECAAGLVDRTDTITLDSGGTPSDPMRNSNGDWECLAIVLPLCNLSGFERLDSSDAHGAVWRGRVAESHGAAEFRGVTFHQAISDGTYALVGNLGNYRSTCRAWVVGSIDGDRFRKMSVLQMDPQDSPNVELYKALDLSRTEPGEDVGNMESRWIRRVTLV